MKTLLPIFISALLLAWLTERTTLGKFHEGRHQTAQNGLCFFLLLLVLSLPVGLRQSYNDTGAYIVGFRNSPPLNQLFVPGELHLLGNPAFKVYCSLIRTVTDNYHIFFLIPAFFVQYAFLVFIRRYSPSFTVGVGLYILLGTYVFTFAAMKQTIAMAILALSIPCLQRKKYVSYYLLVFLAFLFHTYAIAFAILPLFMAKPWKLRTFLLLFAVALVIQNFELAIGSFLDYADESGKSIAEYEVFDNSSINLLRVAVYAVAPVLSLLLRRYLFRSAEDEPYQMLVNMSIISVAIMFLGTVNGANMFGRMAQYFELGMICCLPWMIRKAFEPRSARLILFAGACCFFVYFFYAYQINLVFDDHYRAVTLLQFLQSLL